MRSGRGAVADNVVKGSRGVILLLVLALAVPAAAGAKPHGHGAEGATEAPVTLTRSGDELVLSNGFVRAGFDLRHPGIDALQGDMTGAGGYGADVTASGADA